MKVFQITCFSGRWKWRLQVLILLRIIFGDIDIAIAAILDQLIGTLPELWSPAKSWITDDHWDVKPVGIIVFHRSIPIVVDKISRVLLGDTQMQSNCLLQTCREYVSTPFCLLQMCRRYERCMLYIYIYVVVVERQLFYSKGYYAVKRYAVVIHNIWILCGLKTTC